MMEWPDVKERIRGIEKEGKLKEMEALRAGDKHRARVVVMAYGHMARMEVDLWSAMQ